MLWRRWSDWKAYSPTLPSLYLCHSSFSNPFVASPTSQLILQPFFRSSYLTGFSLTSPGEPPMLWRSSAHSPTFPALHLRHKSFSNPSVASPMSQFILQAFFRFSYATSFSLNSPGESPMEWAELILQPFRHFTYVTTHFPTIPSLYLVTARSPTLPLLHLRHSSFSNPFFASTSPAFHLIHLTSRPWNEQSLFSNLSVTSPTSHLILHPFRRFTYVTVHSPTLPLLHLRHSSFSNPFFASPTSPAFHLIHLASRPWKSGRDGWVVVWLDELWQRFSDIFELGTTFFKSERFRGQLYSCSHRKQIYNFCSIFQYQYTYMQFGTFYSVFLVLRRAITKLSSEVPVT